MPAHRAVLFDLDGTLLPLDIGRFIKRYLGALVPFYQRALGLDVLPAVMGGVKKIVASDGARTAADVYYGWLEAELGVPRARLAELYEEFVAEACPALGDGVVPDPAARAAVEACLAAGQIAALATNPFFPRSFVELRCRWGGLEPARFRAITTLETARFCKPHPGYYREVAALLGVEPNECLMIGNDVAMDLAPAAQVGMATCLVDGPYAEKNFPGLTPDHTCTLGELPALVARR